MKACLITASFLLPAQLLLAQSGGSLTPPGAPGPTMKSLDEMEPRTPLVDGAPGVSVDAAGGIKIFVSGSYYLTGNLTVTGGNGIEITAGGVTLDLLGFTITSSSANASGKAVAVNAPNVAIYNGNIVSSVTWDGQTFTGGPGFQDGISAGGNCRCARIRDVTVQGVGGYGIYIGTDTSSIVASCLVRTSGSYGIVADQVENCVARTCGDTAIAGLNVVNCRGTSVVGDGIAAMIVSSSYGYTTSTSEEAHGIDATHAVENSFGQSAAGDGIYCENGNVANCYGYTARGTNGIYCGTGSVSNCYGYTASSDICFGILCDNGNIYNSTGYAPGALGGGIRAGRPWESALGWAGCVQNSRGRGAVGIDGTVVNNCIGEATGGTGIAANNVMNSFGDSDEGDGIRVPTGIWIVKGIISYSYGRSASTDPSANGLEGTLGIGCTSDGGEVFDRRYLMP